MKKNQDIKSYSGGVNINTYCNIDGAWRTVTSIKTIVDGATKNINEPKVNIDGVWKDETYEVNLYTRNGNFKETIVSKLLPTKLGAIDIAGYVDYSYKNTIEFRNFTYAAGSAITSPNMNLIPLQWANTVSYYVQSFNNTINYTCLNPADSYFRIINPNSNSGDDIVLNSNGNAPYVRLNKYDINGVQLSYEYITGTVPCNYNNPNNFIQVPINFGNENSIRVYVSSIKKLYVKPNSQLVSTTWW